MQDTGVVTVGLADDQQLVRAGFAMVLDSQPDMKVAWEAADGAAAVQLARSRPVDIILMDVQMPQMDGIAATTQIVESTVTGPCGDLTRVVVLTTFDNDEYLMGSITAGASGFLVKDAEPEEIIAAVRTVGDARAVISPGATARLLQQVREADSRRPAPAAEVPDLPDPLTPREIEILVLVARGYSNPEIAEHLVVSLPTVKTHVGRVLAKTGSRDRVHAVLFAFRHGLVDPAGVLGQ